ncbi:hypothetical protein GH714_038636 [Hevea brasiliensis]|uniref:Uncharacterized protein n=1 Tax=Hevea brasiliensis TaxID=3981 RepID=A0A6A6M3H4_HEVBR|nr:hypothetical protein GH714_038636 [Hevea brasiliensis]
MVEHRVKGHCYNCDEPHSFNYRWKKLLCIELQDPEPLDEASEEVEVGEPEISLHAVNNMQHSQTMQLQALIGNYSLTVLVYSGSTNNFISAAAVTRLGIPIHQQAGVKVSVANGEKVSSG